jgi:glycosyltransferase involved in cell wall biosynthesis
MKVFIRPQFKGPDRGEGGIRRWVEAQHRYLPQYGIEIVDSEQEADIVVCHAGDLVNTNKPLVAHCHGLYNTADQQWSKWAWSLNANVIEVMRRATQITAPSKWVAGLLARGMSIDATVMYAGIEPDDWKVCSNDGYVLWNKTRVDPVCDPAALNYLVHAHPEQKFVSTFGNRAANLKLTGKLPYEDAKQWVEHAGVYLSTSKETFGIGTIEAMACGVPVLGWNFGGNQDIVLHRETGYLAKYGDYAELERGLKECIQNRDSWGLAARDRVLDLFTWEKGMATCAKVYEKAYQGVKASPTVSIIVTCYNLEQYLGACLQSIAQQTMGDFECIVVDDCSPGPCPQAFDEAVGSDPRFHYLKTPRNLYLAGARNFGIKASTGRYILCLDADDALNPRALNLLSYHLDNNSGHAIAYGGFELIEPDGKQWVSSWPQQFSWEAQLSFHNQLYYAAMYRREVWERVGGYHERCRTAEDADFWCRVSSFGFRPYKATDYPCLLYSNRPDSMSHQESQPDWTLWYPWSRDRKITPFGAVGKPPDGTSWPVPSYDEPKVSVIIPVGPGHENLVKDALDSVMAQSMTNWEAIVVNDTGKDIDLDGFPWAKIISTDKPHSGPAAARNLGIAASIAPLFLPLDADDYLMPTALERMMAAQEAHGGYVYSDWFEVNEDNSWDKKEAPEFDPVDLAYKGLQFTISCLIPKAAWSEVHGFDTKSGGWEDWDFLFHLATLGYCGTHLGEPLLCYRYFSGTRREDGYADAEANSKLLRSKWRSYFMDGGKKLMGCRSCSKSSASPVKSINPNPAPADVPINSDLVMMEYIGTSQGTRAYRGPVTRQTYRAGANESHKYFFVYVQDVEGMSKLPDMRVVKVADVDGTHNNGTSPTSPMDVRQSTNRLVTDEVDREVAVAIA